MAKIMLFKTAAASGLDVNDALGDAEEGARVSTGRGEGEAGTESNIFLEGMGKSCLMVKNCSNRKDRSSSNLVDKLSGKDGFFFFFFLKKNNESSLLTMNIVDVSSPRESLTSPIQI